LAVFRTIRNDGCLPAEAGAYLVVYQTDIVVGLDAENTLGHLEDRLTAIQKAHGLAEDEFWPPGDRSAEYEDALKVYHDAWDQFFVDRLKADGEHELAELSQMLIAYRHKRERPRPVTVDRNGVT
jgi:hypothetical protein